MDEDTKAYIMSLFCKATTKSEVASVTGTSTTAISPSAPRHFDLKIILKGQIMHEIMRTEGRYGILVARPLCLFFP